MVDCLFGYGFDCLSYMEPQFTDLTAFVFEMIESGGKEMKG
jgi:hypothetical protein